MTKLKNTNLMLDGRSRCGTCSTVKPNTQFHSDASRGNGLSPRCKLCESERSRLRSAKRRIAQRIMVRDLKAIVAKYPHLREVIIFNNQRLAA